jgi:GT2 family glycosyltransferase
VDKSTSWAACVVSYNDPESLNQLLESLQTQTLCPEAVYIVDNNSNNKINFNEGFSFNIFLIKNSLNKGFANAANLAIKAAIKDCYEKFILFSQDVIIEKNGCERLIIELIQKDQICFPKMMNRITNKVFSMGGYVKNLSGNIYLERKVVSHDLDWADGSCLAFSKNIFEKVNGFNEIYFMYFEDVDFCYKAKKMGYNLKYCSVTASQKPNGPSAYLRSRNSIIFAKLNKNFIFFVLILLRNIVGSIKSLITFQFRDARQRLKGLAEGVRLK